jgi:hypothetical protein
LANNNIGPEGLEASASALLCQTRLEVLDLGGNGIGEGIDALAAGLWPPGAGVEENALEVAQVPRMDGDVMSGAPATDCIQSDASLLPNSAFCRRAQVMGCTGEGGSWRQGGGGGGEALRGLRILRLNYNSLDQYNALALLQLVAHLAPHLEELDISNNELDSSTLSTILHTLCRQPPPRAAAVPPSQPHRIHLPLNGGAVDDRMGAMGVCVGGGDQGTSDNPDPKDAEIVDPKDAEIALLKRQLAMTLAALEAKMKDGPKTQGEEEVGGVEGERGCVCGVSVSAQSMLHVLNVSQLYATSGGAGPGLVGSLYPELPLEPLLGLLHSCPIRTLRLGGWYISSPALTCLCHALGPPTFVWWGGEPIPTRGIGSVAGDSSWSLCEGLEAGDCLGGGGGRAGEGGRELEVLELGMTSVRDWATLARLMLPRDTSPLLLLPPAHHPLPHATASPVPPLQHPLLQPLLQPAAPRHYNGAYTLAKPAAALRPQEGVTVVAPGEGIGVTVEGGGAGAGDERARGEGGRKKSKLGKRERLKLRDLRVSLSSCDMHVSSSPYDMHVSSSSYDLRVSSAGSSHVAPHAPACSGSSIAGESGNEAGWVSGGVESRGGVGGVTVGVSGGGGLRVKALVVRGYQGRDVDVHDGGGQGDRVGGVGEGGGRGGANRQKKYCAELEENLEMFFR